MSPLVSVLLPSSNEEHLTLKTIESIACQTLTDFEIAVIADGSESWLDSDRLDPRIVRITGDQSHSIYGALNIGIKSTKSPYIAIARSGDQWAPSKLLTQLNILETDSSIGAVFSPLAPEDDFQSGNGHQANDSDSLSAVLTNRPRTSWIRYLVESGNCLHDSSVLIRREVFEEIGLYLDMYSLLCDYDLWLKLLQRFEIFMMSERTARYCQKMSRPILNNGTAQEQTRECNERRLILQRLFQSLSADDFVSAFHSIRSPGDAHFCLPLEKALYLVSRQGRNSTLLRDLGLNFLRDMADEPTVLSDALASYGLSLRTPHLLMGISSPGIDRKSALTAQEQQLLLSLNRELESKEQVQPDYPQQFETPSICQTAETYSGRRPISLAVFDDSFPCELSAFRYQEFLSYLQRVNNAHVFTTGGSLRQLNVLDEISTIIETFKEDFPQFASSVSIYDPEARVEADLAYCVFLSLAEKYLPFFEKNEIPFAFTLYPGGGFRLDDSDCNARIKKICSSRLFRGVITTQPFVTRYLLNNSLCPKEKITEIAGVVLPEEFDQTQWNEKRLYGISKTRIDVCFAAYKYTPRGEDKGYDIFIECAKQLASKYSNIVFHVIGNFERGHLDVSQLGPRIKFHGSLCSNELRELFLSMDIILSPNRGIVRGLQFDGFPTGACITAAMCGVAVFCSDSLKQNESLRDGTDFVSIDLDVDSICSKIEHFVQNPTALYFLARSGQITFKRNYSFANQMEPRLQLVASLIAKEQTLAAR